DAGPHHHHHHSSHRYRSQRRSNRCARRWARGRAGSRVGAGRARRRLRKASRFREIYDMSNVRVDHRIESDWWAHPIPPNVDFGEGFYCETAQVFRFMKNKAAHALRFGNHVSVYAGCSFALGVNGSAVVGDFTLLNGALVMADERVEIGSQCLILWNVGIADSDFHPLEPAQRLIDARAVAPFYK